MEREKARKLAERFLNGEEFDRKTLIQLPEALAKTPTFSLGLRVYEKLKDENRIQQAERERVAQSAILCSYKDPDVPLGEGLDRAFKLFDTEMDLDSTDDPESLGLAGAVWKRSWELTGRAADLGNSLKHYRRSCIDDDGSVLDDRIALDNGYNAVNAAFVADLRAETLNLAGDVEAADEHRAEADKIRRAVVRVLEGIPVENVDEGARYWHLVSQVEAHFGLGDFDAAGATVDDALALADFGTPEAQEQNTWMLETTAGQLAALTRLRITDHGDEPLRVIARLIGDDLDGAASRALVLGKVGLALSGGGFRAALYHIGVLARLAELDVLRHVEVISTVSGGSIVGALYYLLLKRRLEQEGSLSRDDYLDLVAELSDRFVEGVQTDVRSTLYAGLSNRLADLLDPAVAVGERLGELYEEVFYLPAVGDGATAAGERIHMDELTITPAGDNDFDFKHANWSRTSKVPALVINATTTNTGHVWQFTASYAGESPYAIDTDVDTNNRLRRFYYRPHGAPTKEPLPERRITLGAAVAASSCVPGLFPPTDLGERYDGYRVRLVDGGVHDNQGVISLLEQDCNQLIVSDACGQMATMGVPGGVAVAPLARSNSIMMERIRQEEYARLEDLRSSGRLSGLLFVHLRMGLAGEAVAWQDSEDPKRPPRRREILPHGIRREYQQSLADIRTDLDAFSEVEAFALMESGYLMTKKSFNDALPDLATLADDDAPARDWQFHAVADLMTEHPVADPRHRRFAELLEAGGTMLFRDAKNEEQEVLHYLRRRLRRVAIAVVAAFLALVGVVVVVGILAGAAAGLWTALAEILVVALLAAFAGSRSLRKVREAAAKAELEGATKVAPAVGYAALLKGAKQFSSFHLENYTHQVLDAGRVANL